MDGQRNKRLACDRCRTQKLKCVRQEASEICGRCATAKTPCIFGIQLPPGRTPKSRSFASERRTSNHRSAASGFGRGDPRIAVFPLELESSLSDEQNITKTTMPITTSLSPQDAASSCQWGSWAYLDDENAFNMIYDDIVVEDFNSSTLGSWSTNGNEDLPSSSHLTMGHTRNSNGDALQLIDPDLPTELNNQLSRSSSTTGNQGDSTQSSSGPAFMQKLVVLSSTMYELQSMYAMEEDGSRNIPSDTFPSELAGKVLRVAMGFRESLRGLLCADDSPDSTSISYNNQSLFQGGPSSLSDQSEADDMSLQYQAFLDRTSRSRSDCSSSASNLTSLRSHTSAECCYRHISTVDKPTALQLVSNYLRLLQLYFLLFNAVHEHIRIPQSIFHSRKPIWTDLTVGNAPLSQFADFQIKLVLQVAERVLEEIEDILGLAEGSRVTRELDKEGSGKPRMSVTTHFIDMCIRDFTTGSEQDSGIITELRDLMRYFSQMLR